MSYYKTIVDEIIGAEEQNLKNELLRFMFYFNIFEHYEIENKLLYVISKDEQVSEVFNFFVKRYVDEETHKINDTFKNLFNLERSGQEELKKRISDNLLAHKNEYNTCFEIAKRFRNNLYHGNRGKEPQNLKQYSDCFKMINEFFEINFQIYEQEIK